MKFTLTVLLVLMFGLTTFAQQTQPEKSVAGFTLLQDEAAAKTALQGYSPRYENDDASPKYFFYNEYGNQVMALTAFSRTRPYLIVGIEVFGVDQTYQKKHYQLKTVAAFTSESGFFLGERASAGSMIFGVANTTSAKDVIKKKGAPVSDVKNGKTRTLRYQSNAAKDSGDVRFAGYAAEYEFYKNRLVRYSISANRNDGK